MKRLKWSRSNRVAKQLENARRDAARSYDRERLRRAKPQPAILSESEVTARLLARRK